MDGMEQGTDNPPAERSGAMILGFFLLAFGMPFTLVPVLIFGDSSIDILSLPGLFIGLFCIPFVVAGLGVQYLGISMIRLAINPKDEKAMKGVERIFGDTQVESPAEDPFTHSQRESTDSAEVTSDQTENFWDSVEIDSI